METINAQNFARLYRHHLPSQRLGLCPALLGVSRQICSEARPLLYGLNTFQAIVDMRLHASLRRREVTEADGPEARGQRGIFIEHGMVAFVTSYHKGYSASQRVRILHRYVPREVGELVVYYLWLVQPFVQCLQAAAPQEYDASPWV